MRQSGRPNTIAALAVATLLTLLEASAARASDVGSVVIALGGQTGGVRLSSLRRMANAGELRGIYTPDDVDAIVSGMDELRGSALSVLNLKIKPNLTAVEIVQLLGRLEGSARLGALKELANAGRLSGTYTPADLDLIIAGMEHLRSSALSVLDLKIKPHLTSTEIGQLLGSLRGSARLGGLKELANAGRLTGPYSPADIDLVLVGMEDLRGSVLSVLDLKIKPNLTAGEIAQLLGPLEGSARLGGLKELANAGRLSGPYAPADVDVVAVGMESLRASVLRVLGTRIRGNLSVAEVAQILGALSGPDRARSLQALRNAGRLAGVYTLEDVGAVSAVGATATQGGAAGGYSAPPTATSAAETALAGRIQRLRVMAADIDPYAYGSTSGWDGVNVVAMSLPAMLGLKDYRAMYDQNYFAALEYRLLSVKALDRSQRALDTAHIADATAQVNRAQALIAEERNSFSAASALLNRDTVRATQYVKATYGACKFTSGLVAAMVPGAPSVVETLWTGVDATLTGFDEGFDVAAKQLLVDALTKSVMRHVPLADLDGKTMQEFIDGGTGRLLNEQGVFDALRVALEKDPEARRAVAKLAKELVSQGLSRPITMTLETAIDRAVSGL